MKKPPRAPAQESTFEEGLKALQEVIGRLEGNDLTLEEAIRQFETGCASLKTCYRILCDARARVEVLSRSIPEEPPAWEPFGGGENEDGKKTSERSSGN